MIHGMIMARGSPNENEVDRILQTYRAYRRSSEVQARWNEGNSGNRAIINQRRVSVHKLLDRRGLLPLGDRRILEVGCGSGGVLAGLRSLGARSGNLYGIDLVAEEIEVARRRDPEIHWLCGNGETLEFPSGFFALAITFTVFSSVLEARMARNLADELSRVLEPGGALLWYDFRYDNPSNPHVRGITAEEIRHLFPGWQIDLERTTLLPPLARRLGPLTPILYPALASLPPLRSHYVGLLNKPS